MKDDLAEFIFDWLQNVEGSYVDDRSYQSEHTEVLIDISGGAYADITDLAGKIRDFIRREG